MLLVQKGVKMLFLFLFIRYSIIHKSRPCFLCNIKAINILKYIDNTVMMWYYNSVKREGAKDTGPLELMIKVH